MRNWIRFVFTLLLGFVAFSSVSASATTMSKSLVSTSISTTNTTSTNVDATNPQASVIAWSAAAISASTTTNNYKPQVGKMYFINYYPGLPGSTPRLLSRADLAIVVYFDNVCQGNLKVQRPNGLSEVFHTTVFGALGAGGGSAAGNAVDGSPYSTAKSGLKLGGAYGAVSGLFSGIDGRQRANRYDLGQCMSQMISWAQQIDGKLMGVGIIINSHAVSGKGIKRLQLSDNDNAPIAANNNAAPAAAAPAVIQ